MSLHLQEQPSLPYTASPEAAKPIRVLFYLVFPSGGSGIGRYTHELLERLTLAEDVDPELACAPGCDWIPLATYRTWPGLAQLSSRWPLTRRLRFLAAQISNPRRLIRRARETGADIVHFSNITHLTFPLWSRAIRASGVKITATVHDAFRTKGMINRRYENGQLSHFYRSADALFVHSDTQKTELQRVAQVEPDRIHVVPHGPSNYGAPSASRAALRQRYGFPCDKPLALFFGNIRDDKNLPLLLQALARSGNPAHLVVAGRTSERYRTGIQICHKLVRDLCLEASVTFLDRFIPDSEVADLFTLCDWVALPYSRTFTSQSGVLNVAAQYDRPVVISKTGTFAETVEACDVGVLVDPDDLSSLVEGIHEVQRRLAADHPFDFATYRRVFSWEENARITRAVYEGLLAGSHPRMDGRHLN